MLHQHLQLNENEQQIHFKEKKKEKILNKNIFLVYLFIHHLDH
jgi:hypothetical protein